jgi:CheY-like chemotaxis protein
MQNRNALLLADDDACMRSLVRTTVDNDLDGLAILEAADGAEAIQLGLQERPQLALLDLNMPRLSGIEAAVVLRELVPQLRIALYSAEPEPHRERAYGLGLPLFHKLDLDRATHWLSVHAPRKLGFVCAACGYGVQRSAPPRRCPMCCSEDGWLHDLAVRRTADAFR